jgi:hypothetical protein
LFGNVGNLGLWWSSTKVSGEAVWIRNLSVSSARLNRAESHMVDGFSVRCVKD